MARGPLLRNRVLLLYSSLHGFGACKGRRDPVGGPRKLRFYGHDWLLSGRERVRGPTLTIFSIHMR